MTDKEKVVKGLECLAQKQAPTANPCKDCGYINRLSFAICVKDIASDALELLKEQNAQSVLSNRVCKAEPFRYVRKGFCPKCHQELEWLFNRKHCGFCGQAVKWNG